MTSTNHPFCGNCHEPVASSDVLCPKCGVLLAAYASISGAAVPEATAPDPYLSPPSVPPAAIPDPVVPPAPISSTPSPARAPVRHRPSSQSPIGDALRRSHLQSRTDLGQEADPAAVLADMADGIDELSDMADGHDELSEMASGHDELARMATGASATLTEQVEAELQGAHVDFTGSATTIEADKVTIVDPGTVEPQVEEHLPPSAPIPKPPKPRTQERSSRHETIAWVDASGKKPPARQSDAAQARAQPNASQARTRATALQSRPGAAIPPPTTRIRNLVFWIPFGLLICVVLRMANNVNGFVGFIMFMVVVLIFMVLMKSTRATSRKTTTMPKDPASKNRR